MQPRCLKFPRETESHKFYVIIKLLKISVDLFAILNPRMSRTCNPFSPHCHKRAQTIRKNQISTTRAYLNLLQCHLNCRYFSRKDTRLFRQLMPCLIMSVVLCESSYIIFHRPICIKKNPWDSHL
jgi:hypothetical protein